MYRNELIILLSTDNSTLREHQLILDWLEQTCSEHHQIQVAHYADRSAMAWENTLHQLQVSSTKLIIDLLAKYFTICFRMLVERCLVDIGK